jgi:hypothetical protein
MAATVLVAAVIYSLLRLWWRWREDKIAKNNFRSFARMKSACVSVRMSLQMLAREEDVPFL